MLALCQHFKELSAGAAICTISTSHVNAQNFFLMNEHPVGAATLSGSCAHCSHVTPCVLTHSLPYSQRTFNSAYQQSFPSVVGTDLPLPDRNKQSSVCFIEFFFIISDDCRVQYVSSHPTPLYLKSSESHPAKWTNQLLCKHKIFRFIFAQLY